VEKTGANGDNVLVVENEPGIAKVCIRTLSAQGFQVDIAINGKIALEMWRRKHYNLCISDIMTPCMNGIELFGRLEMEYPDAINKFIFTTGNLLNGEIKAFLEETGRPYLPKPFSPDNLSEIVKTVLVKN
jgi:CheY-like chemotaxis protein